MYQLDFWRKDDYLADAAPEFSIVLPNPFTLDVEITTGFVVPVPSFGNAGSAGNNAKTYDFVFPLTGLPAMSAGDWIIGFQSHHDRDTSGLLRTSGSQSPGSLEPYFSRDNVPRGVLGDQDPNSIFVHWGINVTAEIFVPGDFNHDDLVDSADFSIWFSSFGVDALGDADGDGFTTGLDFIIWQQNFGYSGVIGIGMILIIGLPSIMLVRRMLKK